MASDGEKTAIATAISAADIDGKDEKSEDADDVMMAEMQGSGVHDNEDLAEDVNPHAISFTQFMGHSEMSMNEFLERGYLMANLHSSLADFVAKVLVATRYTVYVIVCVMAGALVTAVGMVFDRIVIDVLTKRFEITVGKRARSVSYSYSASLP